MAEASPCAYPDTYGVPPQTRRLRVFRQPEITVIHRLEQIRPVEDRRMLSGLVAVVASASYIIIAGQRSLQILKLAVKTLLSAEYIEIMETDEIGHHTMSSLP